MAADVAARCVMARKYDILGSHIMEETTTSQKLHLVMGGRVTDPRGHTFADPESLHVVGVFSTCEAAVDAWRAQAQRTVDDAEMKYVVVHIHKLLTPDS